MPWPPSVEVTFRPFPPWSGDVGVVPRKSKSERVWWRAKDPAKLLQAAVDDLLVLDRPRQDRCEKFYKLYGGSRLIGIRPWDDPDTAGARLTRADRSQRDALRLNVVKAAVDTICSKVGKLQPRPTFLTQGGDWSLQLKAKKLQKFIDGAYHQSDAYQTAPDVFRDAMIFGTGLFYIYSNGRRICVERVPMWEVFVDPRDALYDCPSTMYRIRWVARTVVGERWGEKVLDQIALDRVTQGTTAQDDGHEGYVRVVEAWHLAEEGYEEPGEDEEERDTGAEAGRRVLTVGGVVVEDDDWCSCEFPFVPVHWSKPVQGYWGESAVAEVSGIQVEVNKLIQVVQKSFQLVGGPFVFQKEGAILKPGAILNHIGQTYVVESSVPLDQAIQVTSFQPISNQVLQHIWALYAKAFEILGSNQLAASATAPAGLESGRALERLSEEHSERFMTVSRHFEHCVGELLARQFIRVAKELDEELDGGFKIRAPGGKVTLDIDWSEVCMDEDGYFIQVFPTSVLPTTPAARIDEVQRLSDAQWISPAEARRLLNFPDLDQSTDLATADEDNLQRQLSDMLEDGKPVVPRPYQNLQRAILVAQESILRAEADGAPMDNIVLVEEFITMCEELVRRAQPAAAPAPPPQQSQAPAPPGGAPPAAG